MCLQISPISVASDLERRVRFFQDKNGLFALKICFKQNIPDKTDNFCPGRRELVAQSVEFSEILLTEIQAVSPHILSQEFAIAVQDLPESRGNHAQRFVTRARELPRLSAAELQLDGVEAAARHMPVLEVRDWMTPHQVLEFVVEEDDFLLTDAEVAKHLRMESEGS